MGTMSSKPIRQKDLEDTVAGLEREHPTLQDRLNQYRDRRSAYDAKRLTGADVAARPARQGAHRELRG